jgi:membrane protein DedA with SNARE-associated domain
VFFGRFIAVLRMFAALLAGANGMPAGRFLILVHPPKRHATFTRF